MSKLLTDFLLVCCAAEAFRLSIINGRKALIRDFPYQLVFMSSGELVCGAVIISKKFALTAGKDRIEFL